MNKKGLTVSPDNKNKEEDIYIQICRYIDQRKSFVFDAGAGAGKTYTLIQSLKYIISKYGENLKLHNQKIMCITYTNVAAEEIKDRLGNTSIVEVSTIHERIWGIIKNYQEQLVEQHKEKIEEEIKKIEDELKSKPWAKKYDELSLDSKKQLLDTMIQKKDDFYKHRYDIPVDFRKYFQDVNDKYKDMLKNCGNFIKVINKLFKIESFEETIKNIGSKNSKFIEVKYGEQNNIDRLNKMQISHDTLLEYGSKLICGNDLLKRIISDKYPFILVDEYQDTDSKVVETLSNVDRYSKKIGHDISVGYFGDSRQNIYDKGVGKHIIDFDNNLSKVTKTFNRRSAQEIINVANKIRNDDLTQETIYDNFPKGKITFYNVSCDKQEFIKKHIDEWNITDENKLHCFELTNEVVAKQSGFAVIYDFFKTSDWYKRGTNYQLLRDHILGSDIKKLGRVQALLYRILDLIYKVNHDETMLKEFIYDNIAKDMNIVSLRKLISMLKNIKGKTLEEYIASLFNQYNKANKQYIMCISYILNEDIKSFSDCEAYILKTLFSLNTDTGEYDTEKKESVDRFLKIDINEFYKWYEYLINKSTGKIIFHTYHSTKGLEFDNVIIFMQSKFSGDPEYFSRLLKFLITKDIDGNIDERIESARNLLYVAVTRATLNLSILYSEDITEFKENIKSVFGKIKFEL
ncbi:MAG: UvrD-helicase domain-containing protein [Clostridium butyricum]|nr:UvrD-helicase domain-containing protein [Clostridium butyricum]